MCRRTSFFLFLWDQLIILCILYLIKEKKVRELGCKHPWWNYGTSTSIFFGFSLVSSTCTEMHPFSLFILFICFEFMQLLTYVICDLQQPIPSYLENFSNHQQLQNYIGFWFWLRTTYVSLKNHLFVEQNK